MYRIGGEIIMKKIILPLVLFLAAGCSPLAVISNASDGQEEPVEKETSIKYNTDADGKLIRDSASGFTFRALPSGQYSVYSYDGREKEVKIPQTYNDKSVVSIGENAFSHNQILESVSFSSTITQVGKNAFFDCDGLSKISFNPQSLRDILEGAFEGCDALEIVDVPASVAFIGSHAFANCKNLATFIISNSNVQINKLAFYGDLTTEVYFKNVKPSGELEWAKYIDFVGENYTGNNITYTFNTNGGDIINPIVSKTAIELPEPGEKVGYTFKYWSTSNLGVDSFNPLTKYYSSTLMNLYAIWEPNIYKVTLSSDGGSIPYTIVYDVNYNSNEFKDFSEIYTAESTIVQPNTPFLKDNSSVFGGWYTNPSLTNAFIFEQRSSINSDLTLYAKWNNSASIEGYVYSVANYSDYESPFTMSTDADNATFVNDCTGPFSITLSNFSDNFDDASLVTIYNLSRSSVIFETYVMTSSETTYSLSGLYAGDVISVEAMSLDGEGRGTVYFYFTCEETNYPSVEVVGSGYYAPFAARYDSIPTAPVPTSGPIGYEFVGYKDQFEDFVTDANGTFLAPFRYMDNEYLHSAWNPIEYPINYHLDGGTNSSDNPVTYNIESIIPLYDASKTGYDFAGWYKDEELTNPIIEILPGNVGEMDLYAKYSPKTYTANLSANGGQFEGVTMTIKYNCPEIDDVSVAYSNGDFINQPDTPTRPNYAFGGWYSDEELTTPFVFNGYNATKSFNIYAKWNPLSGIDNVSNASAYSTDSSYVSQYNDGSSSWYVVDTKNPVQFYYRNTYSGSYYTTYVTIINRTTGQTLVDYLSCSSTSFYSTLLDGVKAGDVIEVRTDGYYYSSTLCFYFASTSWAMPSSNVVSATSATRTCSVVYNETATFDVPVREGFNFVGFFTAPSGGTKVTNESGTLISPWSYSSNMNLYAHWVSL